MIHPYALGLGALLTSSSVLGGQILPAVLLIYVVLLRAPRAPTPPLVLAIAVIWTILHLLATLVVNLVANASANTRAAIFDSHRDLVGAFGVYEVGGAGSGWLVAGACVPSVLLVIYILLFWRRLARPFRMRRVRPLWTALAWASMSIAAALVAPTVPGAFLLLVGMAAFSCVALGGGDGDDRIAPVALHFCSILGTFMGCTILALTCVSQNTLVARVMAGVNPMYGFSRFYDLQTDVAVRRFLQVCSMTFALFLAQMTLECHRDYVHRDGMGAFFLARGSTPTPEPHAGRRGRQGLLSSASLTSSVVMSGCDYVTLAFAQFGAILLRLLRASGRLIPLALMAANMTAFPSIASLCLLPSLMIGQLLRRRKFRRLLRPSLVLSAIAVGVQYVVFATEAVQPLTWRRLMLCDLEDHWMGLAQVACGEVVFLVMLVADAVMRQPNAHSDIREVEEKEDEEEERVTRERAVRDSTNNRHFEQENPKYKVFGGAWNNLEDGLHESGVADVGVMSGQMSRKEVEAHARRVLGARRVAELSFYVRDGRDEFEETFARLAGRNPSAEEYHYLERRAILETLLLEKVRSAEQSSLGHYAHWIGVLLMRHAALIALLMLFIVGSFTYHMDIFHVIVLVFFGLYFFIPGVMDTKWAFVVLYVMLLTSFELIFTFASQFFELPTYLPGNRVQYATIGLVPLRSRYEAIPYVVAMFVLSILFLNAHVCRSWGVVVSQYEWDCFSLSRTVRQWTMRVTMTIATTVFVALGVFLPRSLIVEGFLGLFLILSIVTAFFGLSSPILRVLWFTACVYSGFAVIVTSVSQFTQVESALQSVFDRFENCAGSTHCQKEIGLFPMDRDMPLTLFLAPWFLAFGTTMLHFVANRAVDESVNVTQLHYRIGVTSSTVPTPHATPVLPNVHDECENEESNGRDCTQNIITHKKDNKMNICNVSNTIGDGGVGGDTAPPYASRGSHSENGDPYSDYEGHAMTVKTLYLDSDDTRFPRHVAGLLNVLDVLGALLASLGADYGGVLVWAAMLFAAMNRSTAMSAAYVVFFLLDFTHLTVLLYCVLQILVLYTYKFSFVPEVTYLVRGVPLANIIGLEKDANASPYGQVIGPVLVFFAVLLRIHTRGANRETRRRQRTEGPESSSWATVLCTQLFYYTGYEAFVLTLLITLALGGDSCSGAAVSCALLTVLAFGRQRFHYGWVCLPVLVLVGASLGWQYALRLNDVQGIFPEINDAVVLDNDKWSRWTFTHHEGSLIGCFFAVMLLHTNSQQAGDTGVNIAMLRAQYGGYASLIHLVRDAGVSSLQRLSEENFDRIVPRVVETSPPSCLGCVSTWFVFAVSYMYPVPILSFATGVASSPCVINLALLMGGLLQVARFEALHWKFFRLWLPIEIAYSLLVCLPPICSAPYVRHFLENERRLSEILGFLEDGHTYRIGPCHILLLFFVALQTRVYSDFRYEKILRRLYHGTAARHSRHEDLWARLAAKCEHELGLAEERNRLLQARLNEVRHTSHLIEDTVRAENILRASTEPRPFQTDADVVAGIPAPAAAPAAAATAVAGAAISSPTAAKPSTPAVATAMSTPQPQQSKSTKKSKRQKTREENEEGGKSAEELNLKEEKGVVSAELQEDIVEAEEERKKPFKGKKREREDEEGVGVGLGGGEGVTCGNREDMAFRHGGESDEKPSVGSAPTPPNRQRTFAHRARRVLRSILLRLSDWMTAHTYDPKRHSAAKYKNLYTRLFWTTLHALERHTAMLTIVVTLISFMLTRTIWEMLPFLFILVIANTYNPFAPQFVYRYLALYMAVGILLKALIAVVLAQVSCSPQLLEALAWTILNVNKQDAVKQHVGYSYVMMDFIVYAVFVVHQDICLSNGVYSRKDIMCSRLYDGVNTVTAQNFAHQSRVVVSSSSESFPASPVDTKKGSDHAATDTYPVEAVHSNANAEQGAVHDQSVAVAVKDEKKDAGQFIFVDNVPNTTSGAAAERDASPGSPPRSEGDERRRNWKDWGISRHTLAINFKIKNIFSDFILNATTIPGVGRDWYMYSIILEAITLIVFVFTYSNMSGGSANSLQESVKRNLLPGPMVAVVTVTIIYLIVDRMLYVTQSMRGKLLLNTMCGAAYCVCYLLWGNLVDVSSRSAGNAFFVLKVLALTLSVLQLRVGYPRHRRHDPFTSERSWILSICYQVYRGIPFLWEVRNVTDWTVERTSLSLGNYFKVEDLHDIVYTRQMEILDAQEQQPRLGTPIRRQAKLMDGLSRLIIMVFVLVAPLVYYSTFNPSMRPNSVVQLRESLSFMSSQQFYSSTVFAATPYPDNWGLWLRRTRPSLVSQGIGGTNTLQLMSLSSCSGELWPISPQAFRQLQQQLANVSENKLTMDIFHSLELFRGADQQSSLTQTSSWTIPPATAEELLQMLNRDVFNESEYVLLRNFYSPFVFNRPDGVQLYSSSKNANTMDCTVQLRRENDTVMQTAVRYWCLKCQSLFTSGNVPTDNTSLYPEWNCLTTGENCEDFNFEMRNGDDYYNPVSLYFAVSSDSVVDGVPFLQGIGIVALYTTFVLAVGRFLRAMFSDRAKHIILTEMADPTPVAQLLEYISIARECGDLRLEQSVYFELIDLLRSPEKLLRLTGFIRRLYDDETDMLHPPPCFTICEGAVNTNRASQHDDATAAVRLKGE